MVRYAITIERLKELITEENPTWLTRAATKTKHFRDVGKYDESSSIWSEIKAVYMQLQHNKCAYCERPLAGRRYGKIEHDIEHFRPKNPVEAWPTPRMAVERHLNYDFPTGAAYPPGYYLLAYEVTNYVTACKTCNTPLKLNYFPIAGERNPDDLPAELPFLIYPLGDSDTDPGELLTFVGMVPVPVHDSGHPHRRAQVTIDFFELDEREELLRQRAERIEAIALALAVLESDAADAKKERAKRAIRRCTLPSSPHCSCVRAFLKLCEEDRPRAEQIAELVSQYLDSQS